MTPRLMRTHLANPVTHRAEIATPQWQRLQQEQTENLIISMREACRATSRGSMPAWARRRKHWSRRDNLRDVGQQLGVANFLEGSVQKVANAVQLLRRGSTGHSRAPGCLVLDLDMPAVHGLELQRILATEGSVLPIIFLTGHGDIPKSVQAMKRGASDLLTKPVNDKDLFAAVRVAIERDALARREQAKLSEIYARLHTLTPREREVLEHVVAGKLNKQIARDLGVTEATIKMHRARVMAKMKVQAVADLVRLAERCGIKGSSQ